MLMGLRTTSQCAHSVLTVGRKGREDTVQRLNPALGLVGLQEDPPLTLVTSPSSISDPAWSRDSPSPENIPQAPPGWV